MKPSLRQVFALVLFALFVAIFAAPRIACASVPNIVDAKGTRYASFNAALANVPNGGSTTLTVTNDVSAPTPVDLTVDRNINVTLIPNRGSGTFPALGNINISAGSVNLKSGSTLFVVTGLTKVSGGSLTTNNVGFYNNIQATGNAKLSLTDSTIQDASYYNKRSGMLATLDLTGKVTCNLYGCNIHGNVYVGSGCTIPHLNRGGITMEHVYTTRGKYGLYVDKGGKVGAISNCTIYGADGSMRFMSRNTTPIEGCTLISGKGKYITPGSAEESDWNGARVEKSLEKTLPGMGVGSYYGYDREFDATWFKTLIPEYYRLSRWTRSKSPLFVNDTYSTRYLIRDDCTLTYDANGGTGNMKKYNKKNQWGDQKIVVAGCSFTMENASFIEWNTKPDGTGTSYKPLTKISFEKEGDITLYAQWSTGKCTVTFDSRGGSKVDKVQVAGGKTVPRPADPTRAHYKFKGWYEDAKCTKEYNFSAKVKKGTMTLYAKWGDYNQCHVWDKGTVQTQPTCTQKGVTLYTCKADPKHTHTKTESNIEPLGHDKSGKFELDSKAERREATCTTPGFATYKKTCPRCNEVIETSQQQTKALGHDWGEWEPNSEGTKETRTCKHDKSHTETRVIKLVPCSHEGLIHVEREESTCTDQGHAEYWTCPKCQEWFLDEQCVHPVMTTAQILLPLKAHDSIIMEPVNIEPTCTKQGEMGAVWRCSQCRQIQSRSVYTLPPSQNHNAKWDDKHYNIIAPTCEEPGYYDQKRFCADCGLVLDWTTREDGKPLGHVPSDPARENVEAPTCEEDGSHEEVVRCTRCGEDLEYTWVHDEPLGHDWGEWETVEKATEFDEGLAKRTCKRDKQHVEWRTIPTLAHEHNMMHIEAEASTCSYEGHKEYWYCNSCGDWYLDEAGTKPITSTNDIMLPRLEHTPGSPVREDEVAPTCTEKGYYEECVYCTVCDELVSRKTVVLQELGHDWDDWKTVMPALGTDSGLERRTCKHDASHTEDRVIHAPHTHTLEHVDEVKATCWSQGKKEHWHCADAGCGAVFSDKGQTSVADSDLVTPPLAHVLSQPVHEVVQEVTCTQEGISCDVVSCTLCGMDLEYTWHYEEPLGHDYGPWETVKEATEFEEGEEKRVCKHDSEHVERRSIPVRAHTHKMLHVAAVDATCTRDGNNEYWYCEKCGEWFQDEAGTQPITNESQVVTPRIAHTPGEAQTERKVDATCTADGHHDEVVYCTVCNEELSRKTVVDKATGHSWGEWVTTSEPTQNFPGYAERTCSKDPAHKEGKVLPALHTHTIAQVDEIPATCSRKGMQAHWECTDPNCGAVFSDADGNNSVAQSELVIPSKPHTSGDPQTEREVAATCTEDGHYDEVEYCTVCNEELSRKTITVHALGHNWGGWQTVRPALGTDAGLKRRVCGRNESHVDEHVIPAPHTHSIEHVDEVPATCTTEGKQGHWECTDPKCGAVFSDEAGKNSVADSDLVIPPLGHLRGEVVWENDEVAATCTTDGHHDEVVRCTVCNAELMRERVIDWAFGHDWGAWQLVEPAQGTDTGLRRRICRHDSSHVDEHVIPAPHTHSIEHVDAVPATCMTEGKAEHWHCTEANCRAVFSDAQGKNSVADSDIVIPPLGHARGEVVRENVRPATCNEDGSHDEVVYCTREGCNKELSRVTVIDRALGHDWGEWKTIKEATEDEEGEAKRICKNDEDHEQTRAIPKKAHVHVLSPVQAQPATCTRPGNKAFWRCTECDQWFEDSEGEQLILYDDEIIEQRLDHTPGEVQQENVIAPTCTLAGSHEENVYCTACNKLLSHKTVTDPALGHDWDEWTTEKEATEEEPGLKKRTCKRDSSHVDEQVIPAKGYPHYAHEVEHVEQTDPTCWAEGQRAHWRCIDEGCGALFSDLDFTPTSEDELELPLTDHKPGEEEEEDFQLASCTEGGRMENAIYCQACGEELGRDSVSIPPIGHNPGEAEREFEQKATCNEMGWYDEAVYCTACEEELSRRTMSEPCTDHTPSEVVILNVVEPTTTTPGSHDELIYCTVCFEELSWKHVEDPVADELYYVAEGEDSSWTMGSSEPLRVVFKRNENDDETFALFSGILVDDEVVDIHHYEAKPGSVVISVSPDYLQTLSVGKHTLTGVFQDGTAVAKFTIAAASEAMYTITYVLNGGSYDGGTDDIVETYPAGTGILIHEAPTREGYAFDYWKGSEYQPGDAYTVTEDHTFVAQWKPNGGDAPKSGSEDTPDAETDDDPSSPSGSTATPPAVGTGRTTSSTALASTGDDSTLALASVVIALLGAFTLALANRLR